MLLIHQVGSVKVGDVVRLDRILPPPKHLYVKIKNTVSAPLRAAYLHGPYTLYVACYPSTFDPFRKHEASHIAGGPEYEPQLKAGGHWHGKLTVPEEVREDAQRYSTDNKLKGGGERKSFTWIIEIASQIIFSKTASVEYELLVARDEKSLDLGFHGVIGSGQGTPGKLEDHQDSRSKSARQHPRGVFSKAIRLVVDDTESLWNTPPFPEWETDKEGQSKVKVEQGPHHGDKRDADAKPEKQQQKQKKIHLVLLTHGIHSNVGADMLFLKESIDTAARQAKDDAKHRREELRARRITEEYEFKREALDQRSKSVPDVAIAGESADRPPVPNGADEEDEEELDEDEEEVYVRGFTGNMVKTEKGIQYLGKRFAKYVLSITYPDQPYLPLKGSMNKSLSKSLSTPMAKTTGPQDQSSTQKVHKHSSIVKDENHRAHNLPYRITSVSFISHSLGGLIQTYAIAYIQKHSPEFFDLIKPVNFVALASPFLGLSNENPMYVKFALDFGLVGRTGQDLGLTWRAPTLAKSGWTSLVSGFTGNDPNKNSPDKDADPAAKPLLRILPTGPAHIALKKFRNRTVYSNVVNDGIVPLRTSCLLFLDWRGLGRVEKARRENGLVGTMVGWGWAEMLGHNASDIKKSLNWNNLFSDSGDDVSKSRSTSPGPESKVPQAETSEAFDQDQQVQEPSDDQYLEKQRSPVASHTTVKSNEGSTGAPNLWTEVLNFFKPQAGHRKTPPGTPSRSPKRVKKIYRRGQTMAHQQGDSENEERSRESSQDGGSSNGHSRRGLVRGASLFTNASGEEGTREVEAPPKTTFFESAGDLLNPPLPSKEFILDPAARPRTIFHDRVYHPGEIPPVPVKRQRTFGIRRSSSNLAGQASSSTQHLSGQGSSVHGPGSSNASQPQLHTGSDLNQPQTQETGTMKIEEKIARAYHKDLSWRKVLVRLEPDAHNNMVVRRMFANAYGWPVVRHICDTHFAYTAAAKTRDEDEDNLERAVEQDEPITDAEKQGESVRGQRDLPEEKEADITANQRRSKTTDNVTTDQPGPQESEDLHTDLRKLSMTWKARDSPATTNRTKRTPSEAREARDDVAELVSQVSAAGESYSTMNSGGGKTPLSRLARQDSSQWSDRFFEGSDDGDDEDEDNFLAEIRKARHRGHMDRTFNPEKQISEGPLTESPEGTKLVRPKGKGRDSSLENLITGPHEPLSAEPGELEPLSHGSGSSITSRPKEIEMTAYEGVVLEPGSIMSLSTGAGTGAPTGTGGQIGLSLGEPVDEKRKREIPVRNADVLEAGSVAEQVALASTKSREK